MSAGTSDNPAPEAVSELLRREEAVFDHLEELAARQRELVVGSDMGLLLLLLDSRKKLSAELTAIERELAPIRKNWQWVRPALAPEARNRADELIGRAGERLRRLMESDEEDARKLSIRKQAVNQTLQMTGLTRHALSAYRPGVERTNRLDCTEVGI